jgi:hypothetical protein
MSGRTAIVAAVLLLTSGLAGPASAKYTAKTPAAPAAGHKSKARAKRGHYSFGRITSINGSTITIKPETPDFVAERAAESGRKLPELAESISFAVDAATAYQRQGQPARLEDYKVGDEIAAVLAGKVRSGAGVALKLLDVESVRQTYGKGGGVLGRRPLYGTVLAVDKTSITLKPEVPDFIEQQRAQRRAARAAQAGAPTVSPARPRHERKLPAESTAVLNAATQYWRDGTQVGTNPFKAGDKVAVYPAPGSTRDSITAASLRDYATVKAQQSKAGQRKRHGKAKQGGGRAGKGSRKTVRAAGTAK